MRTDNPSHPPVVAAPIMLWRPTAPPSDCLLPPRRHRPTANLRILCLRLSTSRGERASPAEGDLRNPAQTGRASGEVCHWAWEGGGARPPPANGVAVEGGREGIG